MVIASEMYCPEKNHVCVKNDIFVYLNKYNVRNHKYIIKKFTIFIFKTIQHLYKSITSKFLIFSIHKIFHSYNFFFLNQRIKIFLLLDLLQQFATRVSNIVLAVR